MHDYLIGLIILQLLMATLYYWILLQPHPLSQL